MPAYDPEADDVGVVDIGARGSAREEPAGSTARGNNVGLGAGVAPEPSHSCPADDSLTCPWYAPRPANFECGGERYEVCGWPANDSVCEDDSMCNGSCIIDLSRATTCAGKCVGQCDGKCELNADASACDGTCYGNCTGTCEIESEGAAALCDGVCQGQCVSSDIGNWQCERWRCEQDLEPQN